MLQQRVARCVEACLALLEELNAKEVETSTDELHWCNMTALPNMKLLGKRLGKALGLPYLPIPASPFPLPVRYHIHYGKPIDLHRDYRPEQADDPEVVNEAALRVKSAVQRLIEQGLEMRQGIFR